MLLRPGAFGGAPQPVPTVGAIQIHFWGRDEVGPSWSTGEQPPYHSFTHSILRIHAGQAAVEVDGTWGSGSAGEVLLVPGFRHLRRRTAGFAHTWIVYSCATMAADLRLARLRAPLVVPADAGWDHGLACIGRLGPDLAAAPVAELAAIEAVLLRAMATMLMAIGGDSGSQVADDDLVRQAVRWLDERYRERPTLAQVAKAVGCSANYLHARFARELGLSPAAYAEQQRLRDAQDLLTQTSLPVQEIARRCGYADPFHFSRVMRRTLGQSPRELRRRGVTH
jgi:AraC family transcriptional regulator, arabinose operon regulatory protein